MGSDTMEIEVLEDGTIKITTDAVSAPNHANAEQFFRFLREKAGGVSSQTKRSHSHTHTHSHVTEGN